MTFHPNEVARRGRIVRVLVTVVLGVLGSAFFRAQVLQRSQFALQSEANRLREVPLAAPRGIILDRNGEILAENLPGYAVTLLPDSIAALERTLETLAGIVPLGFVTLLGAHFRRAAGCGPQHSTDAGDCQGVLA